MEPPGIAQQFSQLRHIPGHSAIADAPADLWQRGDQGSPQWRGFRLELLQDFEVGV